MSSSFPLWDSGDELSGDELSGLLRGIESEYHRTSFLSSDPLEFVHRYEDPWDQEAVALLSSLLAYGNVKQIRNSVQDALGRMEALQASPREFVRRLQNQAFRRRALKAFESYVHRFNVGKDVVSLLSFLSLSWLNHGSLGAHFLRGLRPSDADFGAALSTLIVEWKANESLLPRTRGFPHLLASPAGGSCCKRWCMFLRWMGRKDELDLGLWMEESPLVSTFRGGEGTSRGLRPDQLVMPLDTHLGRISQALGLTRRKTLDWKAALEVTESLKKIDTMDPTRFDFALCRLGILKLHRADGTLRR